MTTVYVKSLDGRTVGVIRRSRRSDCFLVPADVISAGYTVIDRDEFLRCRAEMIRAMAKRQAPKAVRA